jgi:hypothetical protein
MTQYRAAGLAGGASRMRKVVDSNFLQCEKLRAYLSESTDNYVVLTDYAAMEAYKGDTLKSIYRSMEILAHHPKQVIVLKGTQDVCGLSGHDAASPERLIDETSTREFPKYCHLLLAAERGDVSLQRQLLELGHEANAHIDRMLQDSPILSSGFELTAKTYSPAELKILRRRENYTPQMLEKLVHNVLLLTAHLFEDHPRVTKLPKGPEVRNAFIFRYALCSYVLILKWIEVGGAGKAKPETIRNDIVDVNFATFSTYFDGLLTGDNKAREIYADAEFLLRQIFSMP